MKPRAFVLKISVLSMVMMLGAIGTSWAEGTTENEITELVPGITINKGPVKTQITVSPDLMGQVFPVYRQKYDWDSNKLIKYNETKDPVTFDANKFTDYFFRPSPKDVKSEKVEAKNKVIAFPSKVYLGGRRSLLCYLTR